MGEIVNLRRARKRKVREAEAGQAAANRAAHGRSGAEKAAEAVRRSRETRLLDGARLDEPRSDGE